MRRTSHPASGSSPATQSRCYSRGEWPLERHSFKSVCLHQKMRMRLSVLESAHPSCVWWCDSLESGNHRDEFSSDPHLAPYPSVSRLSHAPLICGGPLAKSMRTSHWYSAIATAKIFKIKSQTKSITTNHSHSVAYYPHIDCGGALF